MQTIASASSPASGCLATPPRENVCSSQDSSEHTRSSQKQIHDAKHVPGYQSPEVDAARSLLSLNSGVQGSVCVRTGTQILCPKCSVVVGGTAKFCCECGFRLQSLQVVSSTSASYPGTGSGGMFREVSLSTSPGPQLHQSPSLHLSGGKRKLPLQGGPFKQAAPRMHPLPPPSGDFTYRPQILMTDGAQAGPNGVANAQAAAAFEACIPGVHARLDGDEDSAIHLTRLNCSVHIQRRSTQVRYPVCVY